MQENYFLEVRVSGSSALFGCFVLGRLAFVLEDQPHHWKPPVDNLFPSSWGWSWVEESFFCRVVVSGSPPASGWFSPPHIFHKFFHTTSAVPLRFPTVLWSIPGCAAASLHFFPYKFSQIPSYIFHQLFFHNLFHNDPQINKFRRLRRRHHNLHRLFLRHPPHLPVSALSQRVPALFLSFSFSAV